MSRDPADGPVRVLVSFAGLYRTTNPYITQLARSFDAHPDLEMSLFSWRRALLGSYDVFHVHWPEQLMGGHKAVGRAARRLLTALLCLRLWTTRTPLVRTWHNVERPSGLPWVDHRLLDALDHLTALRIRVNPVTELPPDAPTATILLGDYREWYAAWPRLAPVPGRLSYVGLVRGYKGVEDLVAGFRQVGDRDLSLLVAGKPTSAELATTITDLAGDDPRITLRLEYLDDADFVAAVTSSEVVVLPYRFMHNSSALLAALSLDRPALVPDNEVNRQLADEVGPGWIHLYAGAITPEALDRAVADVRSGVRADRPDLTGRSWERVAADHASAFASVLRPERDRSRSVAR